MPTADVYYRDDLVETRLFEGQFMVFQAQDKLSWKADTTTTESGGGEIHLWIIQKPDNKYYISFVRPDWLLTIDAAIQQQRLYLDVPISAGFVELSYKAYRFVFR